MISAKDLNEEQVKRIQVLADEGATLGEIQKQLMDEFKLSMTYLDARLLIGDLGVALKEDEKAKPEEEKPASAEGDPGVAEGEVAETVSEDGGGLENSSDAGSGKVSLRMSEVATPGMIANGGVTFSDGEQAEWYVDEMGRLGLNPEKEDYRPSEADVRAFQYELQKLAKEEGL